MTAAEIVAKLERVKKTASGWEARCPAHEDNRASLSVGEGRDGRTLLTCHAGCELREIVTALGLTMRDIGPAREERRERAPVVATYPYTDERGKLLFQVQRRADKTFCQRRPDGKGWTYKLDGVRRVLFRLPELTAAPKDEPVWICEGEKDVLTLAKLGLTATCNPMGADDGKGSKWRPELTDALKGRPCIVLEDNDAAGRRHVAWVCSTLMGKATSIKLVAFPELPEHGDVSDFLARHPLEELRARASAAPEWTLTTAEKVAEEPELPTRTLDDCPPEPTEWIVGGVVPASTCLVLASEEKAGKSWLTFDLALALASGQHFLDRFEPRQTGRTLLYSPESGWAARKRRLWGLAWGRQLDPLEVLRHVRFVDARVDLGRDLAKLQRTVARFRPLLLVVDPLIAAIGAAEENESNALQPLLDGLRDLVNTFSPMACIVAHHVSKAAKDRSPFHSLRGSSALGAWSDGLWQLRRETEEWNSARRVDFVHRDEASPDPVGWRLLTGTGGSAGVFSFRLDAIEAPSIRKPGGRTHNHDLDRRVLKVVQAFPGCTVTHVATELGEPRGTIRGSIDFLIAHGDLSKDDRSRLRTSGGNGGNGGDAELAGIVGSGGNGGNGGNSISANSPSGGNGGFPYREPPPPGRQPAAGSSAHAKEAGGAS